MQKEYLLPVSILIAGVLVAGAVIYNTGLRASNNTTPTAEVEDSVLPQAALELTANDVILGSAGAPVTLIEYGDFQCPFCGRFFSQTEGRIREDYVKTGKVRFVYRHFAFLGPESVAAAEANECAKDQGKFWEYHDALFTEEIKDGQENNGNLNQTLFLSLAKNLRMKSEEFSGCLTAKKYADKVRSDYESAQKINVRATPTSFVNGQKVEGALPFDHFKSVIEKFLSI